MQDAAQRGESDEGDAPLEPSEQPAPAGMPRWVKGFAIVGAIVAVLVVLMLTGVLGKGHGPGRHLGGSTQTEGATGIGAPADASAASRTIEVDTSDAMRFAPESIEVSAGEAVTFAATNVGKSVHEFTLGDAAMQQEHAQMMAHIPSGMGHDTANSITLEPGETKQLTWRFGSAESFEYACHQADHYGAGMRGRLTVR